MSYADLDFYKNTYFGEDPGDDTAINKALSRASDAIDAVCNGPIDTSEIYERQVTDLKKANCAQAEFYILNGEPFNDVEGQNVKIGNFSYSGQSSAGDAGMISERANMYLAMSGLYQGGLPSAGGKCDCSTY